MIDIAHPQPSTLWPALTLRPLRGLTALMCLFTLSVACVPHVEADDAQAADDAPATGDIEEDWQVIYLQGQRVGTMHSRIWETTVDEQQRIWTEIVTRMTIKRFGTSLSMIVTQLTEENEAGQLLSFEFENDNPPISNIRYVGRIDGDTLHLQSTAAGTTTESTQPWEADARSPVFLQRQLEADPLEVGELRTMKTFDPQLLKVDEVTLRAQEPAQTTLLDKTTPTLKRVVSTHSLVPGLTTTEFIDDEGNVLKTESNLLQMVTYTVSRDEALKSIAGGELDLAVDTLVHVDELPHAHTTSRIVYEMTLDRAGLPVNIPSGPTQQVEPIDGQTYRITVTSIRPDEKPDFYPAIAADPRYLTCSRQLECEHPAVVKMAADAAGEATDPADIAIAMERYVHQQLKSKNLSTVMATAAEVAQTLEGDCTEHAVLLAALLRAKQIPSRVVVGLVYANSQSAFGGHMWTEAFLSGHWVPLDATLGKGGIGAAHIRFADSSLDDDAPPPVAAFLPLIGLLEHMQLQVIETQSE